MRDAQPFFDRWSDPTFQQVGMSRARGVVTCQPDWYLNTAPGLFGFGGLGTWPKKKAPIRWWQRIDNSQTEIEIPNVQHVGWDKSIDSDAATATITLGNQWHKTNFGEVVAAELGEPGYFTSNRGASLEARSRWGHQVNDWSGRIVAGALLRTYEGHGGINLDGSYKTLAEAIAADDLILTGVWIVDDVTIGAKSKRIELKCRDMMALLIDQILYPPLVPHGLYPLRYQRWVDSTYDIRYKPAKPKPPSLSLGAPVSARYETSSVDAWYGNNATLHGHKGTDSVDGSTTTYALGEGNSGPDKIFAVNYWQYTTGGATVGAINVTCWRGGYTMYISVMENGRWQGSQRVPYDHTPLIGNQPTVVNTHANAPYVKAVGCPTDKAFTVTLPRAYRADRIRISFRHLYNSGIGPWVYRAGVRTFKALGASTQASSGPQRPYGWGSIERHPDDGYWTLSYEGKVHFFGTAVGYGDRLGKDSRTYVDICATITGLGYWLLASDGTVYPFGDAVTAVPSGSANIGQHAVSLCRTRTGNGYWIVYRNGQIREFGDAPDYAPITLGASSIVVDAGAMTQTDYGLWILDDDGNITERGAAPDDGDLNDFADFDLNHGQAISVLPDNTGFIVSGYGGWTSGYGSLPANAPFGVPRIGALTAGYVPSYGVVIENVAINGAGTGYWGLNTIGQIYTRGAATPWGSPADGAGTIRRDGNYKDYSDIIKDLVMWSGWWAAENLVPGDEPDVFGNIESTGIYSPEALPSDMFDKRHPIDPIKQLKEIVGYICWVDDDGAFRWESPNWWMAGNFFDTGQHTDFIPEVDERIQMTDYQSRTSRSKDRSTIIITTDEPTAGFDDTITTTFVPPNSLLRGQIIPAMIKVPTQVTKEEQEIMAELVALHLWFARRQGQITIGVANPAIQINDQVRIMERVTAETFVHYVRGVSSSHDLTTGTWTQTLTTNWLGTEDGDWAITADEVLPPGEEQLDTSERFPISIRLHDYLASLEKINVEPEIPIETTEDIDLPEPDDGSAAP